MESHMKFVGGQTQAAVADQVCGAGPVTMVGGAGRGGADLLESDQPIIGALGEFVERDVRQWLGRGGSAGHRLRSCASLVGARCEATLGSGEGGGRQSWANRVQECQLFVGSHDQLIEGHCSQGLCSQ